MIDTLIKYKDSFIKPSMWDSLRLQTNSYLVLTMHRPSNVDNFDKIEKLLTVISNSSRGLKLIFPCHPRTKNQLKRINNLNENLILIDPLSYLEFNFLVKNSKAVITDSGGITEETTFLGIPCLTLRDNTERPETVEIGTNELVGTDYFKIKSAMNKLFSGKWKKGKIPYLWDGKSGIRIISFLKNELKL